MERNNSRGGFTFIELLIVMLIIGILITFAFPALQSVQERAKITKDMNNLRQIGFATARYLNDFDNIFFSATGNVSWMKRLHPDVPSATQYLGDWAVFQSPWDTRTSAAGDGNTPVSYGVNGKTGMLGVDTTKLTNPVATIFFAPAQNAGTSVNFIGTAAQVAPGVKVYKDTSTPGGGVTCGSLKCGTHQRRQRICVLLADGHADNITWDMFIRETPTSSDPNASCRWDPCLP